MLAQRGWKSKPSPRRGFTIVEASREVSSARVVVAVRESSQAVRLFRSAVDEAMSRSLDLIVLDFGGTPLRDKIRGATQEVEERERSALRTLWANPHVHVVRHGPVESDLDETVSFCESIGASMLVLSADHIGSAVFDSDRVFHGDFDVLVMTDHPTRDRPERETGAR